MKATGLDKAAEGSYLPERNVNFSPSEGFSKVNEGFLFTREECKRVNTVTMPAGKTRFLFTREECKLSTILHLMRFQNCSYLPERNVNPILKYNVSKSIWRVPIYQRGM